MSSPRTAYLTGFLSCLLLVLTAGISFLWGVTTGLRIATAEIESAIPAHHAPADTQL